MSFYLTLDPAIARAFGRSVMISKERDLGQEQAQVPEQSPEQAAREMWTRQGVSTERQDELIAGIAAKAQPGAQVGPFVVGGVRTVWAEHETLARAKVDTNNEEIARLNSTGEALDAGRALGLARQNAELEAAVVAIRDGAAASAELRRGRAMDAEPERDDDVEVGF